MINLDEILEGAASFKDNFTGKLVTETMLVKGINDDTVQVNMSGDFIKTLDPDTAYISIPTRPPHVSTVEKPDQETIIQSYQIFRNYLDNVELLTGYEGNTFVSTGDPEKDILDITAVHPMRKEALEKMLEDKSQTWQIIELLLEENKLSCVNYSDHQYYLRNFN
jgi:wyosine [tRNA(Phe)-imidazoG37] synthetase (radical SAM superfamily)